MKENTKTQSFTKSDLRTGDICIQRDGLVEKFMGGTPYDGVFYVKGGGFNDANRFTETLCWMDDPSGAYDIDLVFRPKHKAAVGRYNYSNKEYFRCIFDRKAEEEKKRVSSEKAALAKKLKEEPALSVEDVEKDLKTLAELASILTGKKISISFEGEDGKLTF